MRLIAVALVVLLGGCTMAPFKVFMGDYTKDGATAEQVSADRGECSREAMDVFNSTAARGQVAGYFMQRHMFQCMKKRGYDAPDIHPDAYKQTF